MNEWDKYDPDNHEDSIFERLNTGFDKIVKKVGKWPVIFLLFAAFAVLITVIARRLYTAGNDDVITIYLFTVLGSVVLWFICLLGAFYREAFHEIFGPFKRGWQAELEEARIERLGGKVSVALLVIEFVIVLFGAVWVMRNL